MHPLESLAQLEAAADRLISERDAELGELAARLAALEPLPPDPAYEEGDSPSASRDSPSRRRRGSR